MEVIRESAGHEFHGWLYKWPGGVFIIPAAIKCDLAQSSVRGKRRLVGVKDSVVTAEKLADFSGAHNPFVSRVIWRIRWDALHIDIGAAAEAVRLGIHRLIHEAARDARAGAIQARDHQEPVGGLK